MTDEEFLRAMLRDLSTTIAKQDELLRRLITLEEEISIARRTIYRTMWVVMVMLLGQVVGKFIGVSALINLIK